MRRFMAFPEYTFSDTAYFMKPTGAMTGTFPPVTSASSTTPRTPP